MGMGCESNGVLAVSVSGAGGSTHLHWLGGMTHAGPLKPRSRDVSCATPFGQSLKNWVKRIHSPRLAARQTTARSGGLSNRGRWEEGYSAETKRRSTRAGVGGHTGVRGECPGRTRSAGASQGWGLRLREWRHCPLSGDATLAGNMQALGQTFRGRGQVLDVRRGAAGARAGKPGESWRSTKPIARVGVCSHTAQPLGFGAQPPCGPETQRQEGCTATPRRCPRTSKPRATARSASCVPQSRGRLLLKVLGNEARRRVVGAYAQCRAAGTRLCSGTCSTGESQCGLRRRVSPEPGSSELIGNALASNESSIAPGLHGCARRARATAGAAASRTKCGRAQVQQPRNRSWSALGLPAGVHVLRVSWGVNQPQANAVEARVKPWGWQSA